MRHASLLAAITAAALPSAIAIADGWATFANQTGTRLVAAPGLGSADPEEKDFAYGDVDNDGDIDLIVVRKQPFTTPTGKRNVFFRNENGTLVDRTIEFATLADDGGQGFLDITNDRDVALGDFNNDGWLDFVTCPALNQDLPKTISHPRIYMNQGNDGNGNWKGFKYEQARIPTMPQAPNGCGIATGDVTGDGFPDIYIVDYLSDQEDRLLINDGTGFFSDQTLTRMTPAMITSGFGTAGVILDINGDGVNDIAKTENGPFKTTYNKPSQVGFFDKHETASSGAHYGMSAGDLNNDGKIDFVVGDDGSDRYLLNTGNGADGMANFESKTFSFQSGGDDGFANNSRIVDLNNDGFADVVICDVDVDIGGCDRRMHLYRNLGNLPSVTIQDQGTCGIPADQLKGTHDVAVFDLDGDGWKDLIIGRCSGISVWMNVPPIGLLASYPDGLPAYITPDAPHTFAVQLSGIGGAAIVAGTPALHFVPPGGPAQVAPLVPLGGDQYEATLPALACTQSVAWWVTAQLSPGNGSFADPPGAPTVSYTSLAALGTEITLREEFENGSAGWVATNDPSVTGGTWTVVDPNGTAVAGQVAAPENDATSGDGVKCWVTQNGPVGAAASAYDVDGGPTYLTSPPFNLTGEDALISFAAWFFCDDVGTAQADVLAVEVSNDNGDTWALVENIATTSGAWQAHFFRVSDFVTPTSTVRVRFSTKDVPNNSTTEAGIDNFQIETVLCPPTCPGDFDASGAVDGADLGVLLGAWGGPSASADLNGDGTVDGADLGVLLGAWGMCP
ncbi:MAG: FG-GAP-like repeat-containing protein [Phycisphaerales bacterium]